MSVDRLCRCLSFFVLDVLSPGLCLSLSPSVVVCIIIQARRTINIAQLGVNPEDLSRDDFYLIELC